MLATKEKDRVLEAQKPGLTTKINGKAVYSKVVEQGFKCALTGVELTPDNAEADHIVPISRGGGDSIDNIQIVVNYANRAKGRLDNDEFIKMCVAVAKLHG